MFCGSLFFRDDLLLLPDFCLKAARLLAWTNFKTFEVKLDTHRNQAASIVSNKVMDVLLAVPYKELQQNPACIAVCFEGSLVPGRLGLQPWKGDGV